MGIESVLIACLPSAITGFCFWCIEQKIQKQSKKLEKEEKQRREAQDKREKLHEQQELFFSAGSKRRDRPRRSHGQSRAADPGRPLQR